MSAIGHTSRITVGETRMFRHFGKKRIALEATLNGQAGRKAIEDEIISRHFPLVTTRGKLAIVWIGDTMAIRLRGSDGPAIIIKTTEFHPRVC